MAARKGARTRAAATRGGKGGRKSGSRTSSAGSLRAARLGVVLLRVFPGLVLIDAAWFKLTYGGLALGDSLERFRVHDYRPLLEAAIADPPKIFGWSFDAYGWFLEEVMLGSPGWELVLSASILFFEGLVGVALVLGLCTRLMAMGGFVLLVAFAMAKRTWILTVRDTNWVLAAMLLAVALMAAGRIAGLDARLRERLPRWVA